VRIAIAQTTTGIDPVANGVGLRLFIDQAARGGAKMLFTPEMSGMLDRNRTRAAAHLHHQEADPLLAGICDAAAGAGVWLCVGSMAFKSESDDGRLVNRSLVINAQGRIVAAYDKIHLFDVDLASGESWRESSAYQPGTRAVVVDAPPGRLGLSVCYDLRFPALYQMLSGAGATLLSIPAAFTVPTGQAHWHTLMRARAIENAAWVIAAAQTGTHVDGRKTYGHSLVVDPWGEVALDMRTAPGLAFAEIDLERVAEARRRIPVIAHRTRIADIGGEA
jgi:deaminated glutathione amidase